MCTVYVRDVVILELKISTIIQRRVIFGRLLHDGCQSDGHGLVHSDHGHFSGQVERRLNNDGAIFPLGPLLVTFRLFLHWRRRRLALRFPPHLHPRARRFPDRILLLTAVAHLWTGKHVSHKGKFVESQKNCTRWRLVKQLKTLYVRVTSHVLLRAPTRVVRDSAGVPRLPGRPAGSWAPSCAAAGFPRLWSAAQSTPDETWATVRRNTGIMLWATATRHKWTSSVLGGFFFFTRVQQTHHLETKQLHMWWGGPTFSWNLKSARTIPTLTRVINQNWHARGLWQCFERRPAWTFNATLFPKLRASSPHPNSPLWRLTSSEDLTTVCVGVAFCPACCTMFDSTTAAGCRIVNVSSAATDVVRPHTLGAVLGESRVRTTCNCRPSCDHSSGTASKIFCTEFKTVAQNRVSWKRSNSQELCETQRTLQPWRRQDWFLPPANSLLPADLPHQSEMRSLH